MAGTVTCPHGLPTSGHRYEIQAFFRGSGDLGATRNIVKIDGAPNYYVFDTAGTRKPDEEWISAGSTNTVGLAYQGGAFRSASTLNPDRLHTYGPAGAFSNATYHVAYTWYDSDSSGGTHESALSPRTPFTGGPRQQVQVSWPTIPDGGDPDDPNSVRLYMKQATSDPGPTFGNYFRQGSTYTDTVTTLSAYNTGTSGSQDTAFPNSGTPGEINTSLGGFLVKGDGTMILPTFSSDPGGTAGQIYYNSTSNKARVYNGSTWNDLF
jgi:hypothetical protein